MNLKVTITFIATEDDWSVSELIKDCSGFNTEEAQDIIKNALLEDPAYVIQNSTISVKEDFSSI